MIRYVFYLQDYTGWETDRFIDRSNATVARNLFDSVHDESDAVHSRLTAKRQIDLTNVTVTGDGLNLASVGRTTTFAIQSRDIDAKDVNVKVSGQ